MSDKTEPPSHRRLEDARQEGQVARSLELNTAVVILAGAYLLKGQGGALVNLLEELIISSINVLPQVELTPVWLQSFALSEIMLFAPQLGIILVGLLAAGIVVTVAQTNFLWSTKKLKFDFKRDRKSVV